MRSFLNFPVPVPGFHSDFLNSLALRSSFQLTHPLYRALALVRRKDAAQLGEE